MSGGWCCRGSSDTDFHGSILRRWCASGACGCSQPPERCASAPGGGEERHGGRLVPESGVRENPDVEYERSDVSLFVIGIVALGILVFLGVTPLIMLGAF